MPCKCAELRRTHRRAVERGIRWLRWVGENHELIRGQRTGGCDLCPLAGKRGGPWVGELQKHLLDAVIEDPGLNTEQDLERLTKAWLNRP